MLKKLIFVVFGLLVAGCHGTVPPEETVDLQGFLQHGETLYVASGCSGCHGTMNGETPPLAEVPDLLEVFQRFSLTEATQSIAVERIYAGVLHDQSRDDERPFENYAEFLVGARLYHTLISGEDHSGFLHQLSLRDPMPAWGEALTSRDIESMIAYLVSASTP